MTKRLQIIKLQRLFLSDAILLREEITLIEEDDIVENRINTARIPNTFFSNIVSNLTIAEYANCDPISDNINNLVVKLNPY